MVWLPGIIVIACLAVIVALLLPKSSASLAESASAPSEGETARPRRERVVLPSVERDVPRPAKRKGSGRPTTRERLVQAGLYQDSFVQVLPVLRLVLMGLCVLGGYVLFEFGITSSLRMGLFYGVVAGVAATISPVFLLDHLRNRRQSEMRRALPDALDVIVVCLEGGLSLPASFARVSRELADTHPTLALELRIVDREVQMGVSLGEAMRNLATRFDLEELRSLATVVAQADRYGASVAKGFKVFARGMRNRRQQQAEERAHKASVKLVLPTALFIFPAMFVVTLGPAVFRAAEVLLPLIENVREQLGETN